jgi:branched-chain amino acid transport system substrate-binding protein
VSKIRQLGAAVQVVFINDYFPHVGTFLKQLRAAGVTAVVLGNSTFSSPTLPDVVGAKGLENVYYITSAYYEGKDVDPGLAKMTQSYQAKFSTFPENLNAITAYQTAFVLAAALKAAGSTDAAALSKAVLAEKDLEVPGTTYYAWGDRYPLVSATVVGFDPAGAFKQVDVLDPRDIK